jgi:hypothetical protein
MDNIESTDGFAKRAIAYVEQNHVLNKSKIEQLDQLFSKLVNQAGQLK